MALHDSGEDRNADNANDRVIDAAFDRAAKPFEWMFVANSAHGFDEDQNVFEGCRRFKQFMAERAGSACWRPPRWHGYMTHSS